MSESCIKTLRNVLPARPFVPGWHVHPERENAEQPVKADLNPYRSGWLAYQAGFFWEAHVHWEKVWLGFRDEPAVSAWCKGLIQLSAACLHMKMGKAPVFQRVGQRGLQHCLAAGDAWDWGLDAKSFLAEWTVFLEHCTESSAARPKPTKLPNAIKRRTYPENDEG